MGFRKKETINLEYNMATVWAWLEFLFREIGFGTLLVFTLVFLLVLFSISIPHTDIPGPFALPLVGNLPLLFHMGKRRQKGYFRLQKKYGNVFRLFLGRRMLIILCGRKNIHDAFVRHGMQTSNRPDWLFDHQSKIKHGNLGKKKYILLSKLDKNLNCYTN